MFDLRGLSIGAGIVAVFLVGYFGVKEWPRVMQAYDLHGIVNCVRAEKPSDPGAKSDDGDTNSTMCVRPYIRVLLEGRTGGQVMALLDKTVDPEHCHYFGHVVGQEIYKKDPKVETGLNSCSRECDSACIHGVIGQAFAQKLGIVNVASSTIGDLEHLSPKDVQRVGAQLCASPGPCHGVGHTIFQIYLEFPKAFAMCRQVSQPDTLNMCYNGVTMEYADALSARTAFSFSDVPPPKESDLPTLCTLPTIRESRACFRYFVRMVDATLSPLGYSKQNAKARVIGICDSYDNGPLRLACYGGIGADGSYSVIKSTRNAVATCESLGSEQAAAGCMLGMLSVATEDRKMALSRYCAASSAPYRDFCYRSLFFFLTRVKVPDAYQRALCKTTDTACLDDLKNRGQDPAQSALTYPR